MSLEVTDFSDSSWAGGKETRKSSSAEVALVGRHFLKAYTRKQQIIARSSAEAECVWQHWEHQKRGVEGIMRDLGFAVKPVCVVDAKAAEHMLHRHGIGKMKHIDVAHSWLRDELKSNRMKVCRVKSVENLVAIGTKALSNKITRKHATSMLYIDAQENLKSGDVMGFGVGESERADQSSPAHQKTSFESTSGHARQFAATAAVATVAKSLLVSGTVVTEL